ncbi:hypothetical protein [Psychrobacter maritimus]|uniref:hypothetical protein n=1 Tax=Psychrobacter maritimus TaxID=256325 RepID=UPI003568DA75
MQLPSSVSYKSSASAIIYRDGGSLELRFTADDDRSYCIFMEVVNDSPDDCKRYHPPMLFKGSFDINNSKPQDFIGYLTWKQIKGLVSEIKMDISQDVEKRSDSAYFELIENIANNNGWLIKKNTLALPL